MDGTVGLSWRPVEISGRNYMLRHGAAELIRHDPAWNNGEYDKTPSLYMYAALPASVAPVHCNTVFGATNSNSWQRSMRPWKPAALT